MNPASHSPLTFLAGPCIRNAYTSLVSKEKLGNEVARSLMYRARVIGKKEAISQLPALFVFLRMPLIDVLAVPIAVFSFFFFFFLRNATIIDKLDRGIDLLENIVSISISYEARKIQISIRMMRFRNCREWLDL